MNPSSTKKKNQRNKKKKTTNTNSSSSHFPSPSPSPSPSEIDNNNNSNPKSEKRKKELKEQEVEEESKAMAWLADAFSTTSIDQIMSAYNEADRDVYKAAGILSTEFFDPGETQNNDSNNRCFDNNKVLLLSSRRRKARTPAASTGMVSDMIGKSYSSPKPELKNGKNTWGERAKLQYSVKDAEQFLCSMLGDGSDLGMDVVKDVFSQCGYDVQKALDALINISDGATHIKDKSSSNYRNTGINYSSSCPELSSDDSVGDISRKFQSTEKMLGVSSHPSHEKHEFLQSVGHVCRDFTNILAGSMGQPPACATVEADLQQKVLSCLFNISESPKYDASCMNWKKVVEKVESFGQGLEYRIGSNARSLQTNMDGKEDIYQFHRSTAKQHWETMKTYYRRAAVAYAEGERAHASYLSEQGNHFRNLAHVADEKAARDIFEARNKDIKNAVTIDLHGQHVKQAMGLLKLHLLLFAYILSIHFLKVITGCGSDGVGRGKLKRSVIDLAEKEGIEWSEENAGSLVLRLRDERNTVSWMI